MDRRRRWRRRGCLMLRMRSSFSLIARVYESLVAHKEVTPRKGFGADVAYKSTKKSESVWSRIERELLTAFLLYVYECDAADVLVERKDVGNAYSKISNRIQWKLMGRLLTGKGVSWSWWRRRSCASWLCPPWLTVMAMCGIQTRLASMVTPTDTGSGI